MVRAWLLFFALVFSVGGVPGSARAVDDLALLAEPGHHLILRHALAPGTGDPAAFSLDDCATQRNLNETGRRQARDFGARIAAAGLDVDDVFTSQWCRCRDTATEMDVAPVSELPALNSFFRNREREPAQTAALKAFLLDYPTDRTAILVTHQVNITALTGNWVDSGAGYILKVEDGRITVVGSVDP